LDIAKHFSEEKQKTGIVAMIYNAKDELIE